MFSSRRKKLDSTPDLFGDRYTYRCIITNDWDSEEKSIIETYNKRGARERDFDRLNNDFGWKHLPCSFLNENTVYIILTAFCTKSTIICVEGSFKCGTEGW